VENKTLNDVVTGIIDGLSPKIIDPEKAKQLEMRVVRGKVPICPFCGATFSETLLHRLIQGKRVQCPTCDKRSSLRTGTVLAGSTLSSQEFAFIVWCFLWEIPLSHVAKTTGISLSSLYRWQKCFGK